MRASVITWCPQFVVVFNQNFTEREGSRTATWGKNRIKQSYSISDHSNETTRLVNEFPRSKGHFSLLVIARRRLQINRSVKRKNKTAQSEQMKQQFTFTFKFYQVDFGREIYAYVCADGRAHPF